MRLPALFVLLTACGSSPSWQPTTYPNVRTQALTLGSRSITLYGPGFSYDPAKAYFLVLDDGQDVVQLRLASTLADLWDKGQLAPMIVIAVPAEDRLQEYGTAEHDVSIPCSTDNTTYGNRAAEYATFVRQQLLPAVEHAVGFRPPPAHVGLLGVSLGGLSAFSTAWDHPEAFGFAGAMSGSFWWRTDGSTVQAAQATRIMQNIVARGVPHPGLRAFFSAGTDEETADRDGNGVIDVIDDTLWLMQKLDGQGMVRDRDYTYVQVDHGIHGYPTWSFVLPQFLTWAAAP